LGRAPRDASQAQQEAWCGVALHRRRRSDRDGDRARLTMVPLATWLVFCIACAALAVTPGPNLLYLVSRTLVQGRAAGLVSLAGTATGLAFHIIAAALGLSALLATVPAAYDAVRWAGAVYLAWLAWQTWRAPATAGPTAAAAGAVPMRRVYRDGVLTVH